VHDQFQGGGLDRARGRALETNVKRQSSIE
jgi:hypothetical protein